MTPSGDPTPDPDDLGYDPLDPQRDCFHPPSIPTLVWCLHCGEEYDSWKMEYRVSTGYDGKPRGFWCCGIEGCDGVGFGFDIHPVDPDYIDPDGREMGRWEQDPPPDPETDLGRPPDEPTPVRCERCGKEYSSADMVWEVDSFDDDGEPYEAFWTCPTEGCHGMDFGLDIRPTDPNFIDPDGRRTLRPGEVPESYKPPSGDGTGGYIDEDDIPF